MSPTIVLAGGGTGGHVYPLIAVAEALRTLLPELRIVFVGTERGLETRIVPEHGFELELVEVRPIRGFGVSGALRGVWCAMRALPSSRALLEKLEPCAVLTVGGYAAGPVSLMARRLQIPVGLLEPNAVMGLANRWMAPFVQRAYTAFSPVERHFTSSKVRRTGVPIRAGFSRAPYVLTARPRRVLVLGGSQGARTLNERVPLALGQQSVELEVRHQCGKTDVDFVKAQYSSTSLSSVDVVSYIDEMPPAIAWADLIISRAGASAVSEICAVGRPSLLVPYPFSAGQHQQVNAETLASVGAAKWLLNSEISVERMAQEVAALLQDADTLIKMADFAAKYGKPNAARDIAVDLLALGENRISQALVERMKVQVKESN